MGEVYKAIAAVQGELAKTGIAKNRKNTQGSGYNFRGIDDVYAALSPLLATHGLVIIPRMTEREVIERTSKSGGALFYTTVKADFDFVSAVDGSVHTACTYGEAMDSGDKSTNKAMSAAYKYAAFLTFAIPTEGDNDADATTHEVAPAPRVKLEGPYTSKTALWTAYKQFVREVESCGDADQFAALIADKDSAALIAQVERDAPNLAVTGEGLPSEFVPMRQLLAGKKAELETPDDSWRGNVLNAG